MDEVAWIMMLATHLCLVPDVMRGWRYTSTERQNLKVGCSASTPLMFRFYQRVYCIRIICNFCLTYAVPTNYRQAKETESVFEDMLLYRCRQYSFPNMDWYRDINQQK
jgi:hypothetical protein